MARVLAAAGVLIASLAAPAMLHAAEDASVLEAPPQPPAAQAEPEPAAEAPAAEAAEQTAAAEQSEAASGEATGPSQPASPPPVAASSNSRASAAAAFSVSIGDNFYAPASISVSVGDSVTWRNNGQAQHSATADDGSFDTGVFGPGQSRSQTFDTAGTFGYYCTVHGRAQSGTVRVSASSGGKSGGGGGGGTAIPGPTEAAATASPNAAGSSTSLPATGAHTWVVLAVGLSLLAAGLGLRARDARS
jgi:LPXTG-motif cell wall-anchored protein